MAAVAGERLRRPDLARRFYTEHGNELFWSSHPQAARALLDAVFHAEDQGLDPALFHTVALSGRGAALSPVARDVLISDAILSYADALAEGAVPRQERPWTQALHPVPIDVVAAVDRAITAPDPAAVVAALAPASPEYEVLRRAYAYYYAHAIRAPATQEEASYPGYAEDDDGYDEQHQSHAGTARSWRSTEYPYLSSAAVRQRARQIAAALERLRWLPRSMPRNRVVVNTATQQLQLFQDGQPVFATRVVVGQPTKQTPEFHTTINDVLFNPPWNVPSSILREEILPKLAEDPDYLTRHHMRWHGPMAVQQEAGPYSALGRLKFEMSDPYDVYLHDTPEKHLFRLAKRTKSHSCVRVEYPQDMAALVLHESPVAIQYGIAEGRTYIQPLPAPLDVYIVYQTVIIAPSGAIEFHADPYERDAAVWQLLARPQGAPMAQNDGIDVRGG
jgi:murein L,D-transpeptidase YcbB/YkuD